MSDQKITLNIASLVNKVIIVNTCPEASLGELEKKIKEALEQVLATATKGLVQENPE